jgi:hypothetical protein
MASAWHDKWPGGEEVETDMHMLCGCVGSELVKEARKCIEAEVTAITAEAVGKTAPPFAEAVKLMWSTIAEGRMRNWDDVVAATAGVGLGDTAEEGEVKAHCAAIAGIFGRQGGFECMMKGIVPKAWRTLVKMEGELAQEEALEYLVKLHKAINTGLKGCGEPGVTTGRKRLRRRQAWRSGWKRN